MSSTITRSSKRAGDCIRGRLRRRGPFPSQPLFVVAGAWNIYCETMQIQGSGTIRATMLCTTPRHTDTDSVWSWWRLPSAFFHFNISVLEWFHTFVPFLPPPPTPFYLFIFFTDCQWNTPRCGGLNAKLTYFKYSTSTCRQSSNRCVWFSKLMETSGTDILNDSDVRAPVSPLHLAVSLPSIICCPLLSWFLHAFPNTFFHLSGVPWTPPCDGGPGAVSAGPGCEKQSGMHAPGSGCL